MSLISAVAGSIARLGGEVAITDDSRRSARAIVEPLRYRNRIYIGGEMHPLGQASREKYLFIGTPDPKPARGKLDFSIIKSWLLQIYRKPGDFSRERRDAMRRELFEGEQLQAALAAYENPEEKMREYLGRLCREYIEIFLKEDNQLMGNIFGLRIGRNRDKILEDAVSGMIRQIEADEQLTAERKQMLKEAMAQALKV